MNAKKSFSRPFIDIWTEDYGNSAEKTLLCFSLMSKGKLLNPYLSLLAHDLSPLDSRVLLFLYLRPNINMTELASALCTSRTQISKTIDNLFQMEYTDRHVDKNDRRVNKLFLTEKAITFLLKTTKTVFNDFFYCKNEQNEHIANELLPLKQKTHRLLPLFIRISEQLPLIPNAKKRSLKPFGPQLNISVARRPNDEELLFVLITVFCFVQPLQQFFCADNLDSMNWQSLLSLKINGAMTMSKLAESIGTSPSQCSKTVNELFEMGYVDRNYDKRDRRLVMATMTSKGQGFFTQTIDNFYKHIHQLLSSLTNDEQELFLTLLDDCLQLLDKIAPPQTNN